MKRIFVLLLITGIIYTNLYCQKQGNVWCFGDSSLIDFNDNSNIITGRSIINSRGSASSISDSLGNLLFYVGNASGAGTSEWEFCRDSLVYYETGHIFNKVHTFMENGRCVSGEGWYDEHTIIPMPGNDSLYYKFSVNLYEHPGIDYSIVDINANAGLGKVIERDVSVASYTGQAGLTPVSNCLKAIRHGNGRDWWLVTQSTGYNLQLGSDILYLLLKVSPEGIEIQQIPLIEPERYDNAWGFCGFNKDGNKFYTLGPTAALGTVVLYDFDRCTGVFSNQKVIQEALEIDPDSGDYYPLFWNAEFSPSSRYLYVNTIELSCNPQGRFFLFQYDLEDEFPALTRDTILDYYAVNAFFKRQGGSLRLAPDGKIYYSRAIVNCNDYWWPYPDSLYHPFNMNLSVINNPDSAYPACNFTPYSFYLGGARTYYGLPNNPNFALGAVEGACDTTANGLNNSQKFLNTNLNIFPNPCYNSCQIQYKPATQKGSIVITNIEGKVIFTENEIPISLLKYGYEINTAAFAKGVYFVNLVSGGHNVTKKLVRL